MFADVLSLIKKEVEAGTLPPSVAAGMEEVYNNYKSAVSLDSFVLCLFICTCASSPHALLM